jgi:aryl-alcohol dehydrogenase-like predicted oxidoreductase
METTTLGRTGLKVSVMGLGCGGHSRLGLSQGKTEAEAIALVRKALDLGITFIDTAEGYGTEPVVGKALRGIPREQVVISTKVSPRKHETLSTPEQIREQAEGCLQRLQTDYLDILHLHGVAYDAYPYVVETQYPVLDQMRQEGKIGFVGITEAFASDPPHRMLSRAIEDDFWDVMMIGFNILNQSARERLFAKTRPRGIGVLGMFAVRRALSRPEALCDLMQKLAAEGLVDPTQYDPTDPLGFLLQEGKAQSLPDAGYRFCRYEPGMDVVLSGTGDVQHLEENAASLSRPPLPEADVARLRALFHRVDTVSGQ